MGNRWRTRRVLHGSETRSATSRRTSGMTPSGDRSPSDPRTDSGMRVPHYTAGPNFLARPDPGRVGSGRRLLDPLIPTRPPWLRMGSSSKRGTTCRCACIVRTSSSLTGNEVHERKYPSGARRASCMAFASSNRGWIAVHSATVRSNGEARCALGTRIPDPGRTPGGSVGSCDEAYTQCSFSRYTSEARSADLSQNTHVPAMRSQSTPHQRDRSSACGRTSQRHERGQFLDSSTRRNLRLKALTYVRAAPAEICVASVFKRKPPCDAGNQPGSSPAPP
jgi:hypothetical protein